LWNSLHSTWLLLIHILNPGLTKFSVVDNLPNHGVGSDHFWPSSSCPCTCCFSGFIPSIFYPFWPFHVVSWDDFWLWPWLCYNNGWNNHWDGPPLLNWTSFPWSHSCKSFCLSSDHKSRFMFLQIFFSYFSVYTLYL